MDAFTKQHRQTLRDLWNEACPHDGLSESLFDEKVWNDRRPGVRLAELVDGRPAGFVVSVVDDRADEPRAWIKLLAVAPEHRGRGLGSRLLAKAERAAWDAGAGEVRLAESAPNYLTPGVDTRYERTIEFFARRGYTPRGEAVNMTVSLADLPKPEPAEGCLVRRAAPGDAAPLRRLLDANWPSWNAEVAVSLAASPPTLFIAEDAGAVIGFAAYESNNLGTGWFGPMGTDPAARGRGVGRLLLLHSLAAMRNDGFERAIIPWVGPAAFYERQVGAAIDRRFTRLAKHRPNH